MQEAGTKTSGTPEPPTEPHPPPFRPAPGDFPLAIAHRGYSAVFPENSMAAFRAAAEIGAHAVEADVHLSRDGIVVLAHVCWPPPKPGLASGRIDPPRLGPVPEALLRRQPARPRLRLGLSGNAAHARTAGAAAGDAVGPARVHGVGRGLGAVADGGHQVGAWPYKMDDPARELLSAIARAVAAAPGDAWARRIVVLCWTASWLRASREQLPELGAWHVGMSSAAAAWQLVRDSAGSGDGCSLRQATLVGPVGAAFRRAAAARGRGVCAWTVNDERWMRWCIGHRLDGVVTDNPRLFLDVCRRVRDSDAAAVAPAPGPAWWAYLPALATQLALFVFYPIFLASRPSAHRTAARDPSGGRARGDGGQ